LGERLGLLNLHEQIAPLVDEGKINLSNAYALSKLPKEEQANFLDNAMTMTPQEFAPTVMGRKKELDKAKRTGKDPAASEYVAVPYMRKLVELKAENESPVIGPVLCRENNLTTAEEGFAMAMKYALHMDPTSISVARAKHDAHKADVEQKRKEAADARAKKRADDATTKAARLKVEADALATAGSTPETVAEALAAFDAANTKS